MQQSSRPSAPARMLWKEEPPRPESPYHAFGPRSLRILDHSRPPRRAGALFRERESVRAKLRSKGGLGLVVIEPTGQGFVASKLRAHARGKR